MRGNATGKVTMKALWMKEKWRFSRTLVEAKQNYSRTKVEEEINVN